VISAVTHRVNYSETDQMGFVYHANYLVWMDMARTEHLRERGVSYKELEAQGVYLAVTDIRIRYRQPAQYDDLIRIRCWVKELASRRVIFEYAVERAESGELLATAESSLMALDRRHFLSRIPEHVRELLEA
jgi:acyl-CoA thioester hydrolase